MSKKVWGVLCNDEENSHFICLADECGIYIDGGQIPTPVSKKRAIEFAEKMNDLYPNNIYSVFKMKFKETI